MASYTIKLSFTCEREDHVLASAHAIKEAFRHCPSLTHQTLTIKGGNITPEIVRSYNPKPLVIDVEI
ncbi:hypothetical protein LCGC14_1673150 [marine sediment metagenome]|uniref:Uncharacterized protein n=1 Tax=marine sediment metagenome TaxID=412755 RepID=A0A0F9HRG4_9ZZZZ